MPNSDYTVHGILQTRLLEWVVFPFSRGLPDPGIEPRSPILQAESLPAEPSGKPKNTGVGSLSLLQWVFPTQESNPVFLHCRWILYQLSYLGCLKQNPEQKIKLPFAPGGETIYLLMLFAILTFLK